MKTLNLAQLDTEELTNQELIETQGGTLGHTGGLGGSLISVGDVHVSNLLTNNLYVAGNNVGNDNDVLSSSNGCGC